MVSLRNVIREALGKCVEYANTHPIEECRGDITLREFYDETVKKIPDLSAQAFDAVVTTMIRDCTLVFEFKAGLPSQGLSPHGDGFSYRRQSRIIRALKW